MSLANNPRIGDWIGVQGGHLLVRTGKVDIGQRISTALAQIAHEELTIPHALIDMAPVRTGHAPDEGITSGSNSVEQSGNAVRRAAATLRLRLIARAADMHGGLPADWVLADGVLHLPGTNHRLTLIEMTADPDFDALVDPRTDPLAQGAPPAPPMRGIADMVRGRFTYIQDLEAPGMLHARIVRPPHANARLRGLDREHAKGLPGDGLHLVRDGSFLAIAGPQEWPVVRAALAFQSACDWDPGGGLPETDVFARLSPDNACRLPVIDATPVMAPVPEILQNPDHAARYERPYQLHGALGPSAAVAHWNGTTLTLHSQSQGIYPLRASIADSLGLDADQVDITHIPGSGCYGHNGADDAAFEAALIAMAIPDRPILLKWTREDEHGWEPFAPAMAVEIAAQVKDGHITSLSAEVFSDTHRGRPRPDPGRAGPGKLLANRFRAVAITAPPTEPNMGRHAGMHRNLDPVYDIPYKRMVKNLISGLPHRTSAMRCLGAAANIFALESSMDDMARAAGADPLGFRRDHLGDPRALAVLESLQHRIVDRLVPKGGGRGVAYAQYKNQMTRVGLCVDLVVDDRGRIQLKHVDIVADAGRIIDPAGLCAQLEGGFIQGASWALYEAVNWNRDGISSRDWDSYPVIRFTNIPIIEVALIDRPEMPSVGAGEAAPGPAIAAIANAIFSATGIRMRRMPFSADAILREALHGPE